LTNEKLYKLAKLNPPKNLEKPLTERKLKHIHQTILYNNFCETEIGKRWRESTAPNFKMIRIIGLDKHGKNKTVQMYYYPKIFICDIKAMGFDTAKNYTINSMFTANRHSRQLIFN